MNNIVDFPTPREQAGVTMLEDMDMLLDCLMGAMVGIKNSDNVDETERDAEMQVVMDLFIKYVTLRGERYPSEEE